MSISKTHPIDRLSVERLIDKHPNKPTIGVVINDPAGMHVRVATYLIKIAQKYEDTTLQIKPQDADPIRITHKSILTLMTLGLTCGSQFEFIVNGPHAHDVQKEMFDLKIDGLPIFLPEGSAVSESEYEPLVTPKVIAEAFRKKEDPALNTYMRIKAEIGDAHESLSFVDFNITSPGTMIGMVKQFVQANPKEEIPAFIDYHYRMGVFGKMREARHRALTSILQRHFGIDNYAPDSLTPTWIARVDNRPPKEEYLNFVNRDSLILSFLDQAAMNGLLTLFGRHAGWRSNDHDPSLIELTPDPNHNGSSSPTTNHGGSPIMPPTSVSGASMSPFMSSGLLTRSFGPSLAAPSPRPIL